MKLPSRLMSAAAIASLLVAVGATSGDAGNVPAVTGFILTLPSMDFSGPAGEIVTVSPSATWGIPGADFTLAGFLPECCTGHEAKCVFTAFGASELTMSDGQEKNGNSIVGGAIILDIPRTVGEVELYSVTLYAHCSALSLSFNFATIYSNPIAETLYRVTAR